MSHEKQRKWEWERSAKYSHITAITVTLWMFKWIFFQLVSCVRVKQMSFGVVGKRKCAGVSISSFLSVFFFFNCCLHLIFFLSLIRNLSLSFSILFPTFYTKLFSDLIPSPPHFVFIYLWYYSYFGHEASFSTSFNDFNSIQYRKEPSSPTTCTAQAITLIWLLLIFFFWLCSKF